MNAVRGVGELVRLATGASGEIAAAGRLFRGLLRSGKVRKVRSLVPCDRVTLLDLLYILFFRSMLQAFPFFTTTN